MVLMSTDLPAPLSPTNAVTWPAGTSRSTFDNACTAPNDVLMPLRLRRAGADPLPTASAGMATGGRLLDVGGGARCQRLGDADVCHLHGTVLDHRRCNVPGGDPRRG